MRISVHLNSCYYSSKCVVPRTAVTECALGMLSSCLASDFGIFPVIPIIMVSFLHISYSSIIRSLQAFFKDLFGYIPHCVSV
jgi:hypothetical protein